MYFILPVRMLELKASYAFAYDTSVGYLNELSIFDFDLNIFVKLTNKKKNFYWPTQPVFLFGILLSTKMFQ